MTVLDDIQFDIIEEEDVESPLTPYRAGVLPRFSDKITIKAIFEDGNDEVGETICYYSGVRAWSVRVRVDEDWRENGIASRLYEIREDYLKERGVEEIHTYGGSNVGTRFAKKRGFESYEGEFATPFNPIRRRL